VPVRRCAATHACDAAVDLYLHNLALDNLALLGYSHADGFAEGLCESLGLGHLERKDFRRGEHGEGHIGPQRLRHAHGDGRLARARRARDEDGAACNLAVLRHLEDDRRRLPRLLLPDEPLRRRLRLERVGLDAEAADVRVRRDEVEPAQLLALGDGRDWLHGVSVAS
jgi:hypothetical protein